MCATPEESSDADRRTLRPDESKHCVRIVKPPGETLSVAFAVINFRPLTVPGCAAKLVTGGVVSRGVVSPEELMNLPKARGKTPTGTGGAVTVLVAVSIIATLLSCWFAT